MLVGLWGFAFVHPVLGMLGAAPAFFATHGVAGAAVVLWAISIITGPPILLLAVYAAIRTGWPAAASAYLAAVVGVLLAITLAPHIDNVLFLPMAALLVLAGTILTLGILVYLTSALFRRLVAATWFSPLVFLAVFLFFSASSELVLPGVRPEEVVIRKPVELVMVVFDEFPLAALLDAEMRIDSERFPGFAALADQSTWYRNTTTTSVWTAAAVPALVTGQNPGPPGSAPAGAREMPRNLFSMLYRSHELNLVEQVATLCGLPKCNRIEPPAPSELYRATALAGFRAWVPEEWAEERLQFLGAGWSFRPGEDRDILGRFDSFISRVEASGEEHAVWFTHVMAPHRPYVLLPGGLTYPGGWDEPPGIQPGEGHSLWHSDERIVELMRQRLVLQIQAVDELIGRLATAMDSGTVSRDAMVVVAADHGISFDPRLDARGGRLDSSQIADIAAVPLFIRYPRQSAGDETDAPASLVDVVPTISDVMGAELPASWDFDGESLSSGDTTSARIIYDSHRAIELPDKIDLSDAVAPYLELGGGPDPGDVFGLGPLAPLVGNDWGELEAAESGLEGQLEDAAAFRQVDLAEAVPALVQVTLDSGTEAQWGLVAVNGTVAGTGPIYEHEGEKRLVVMVDPRTFVAGENRLQAGVRAGPGGPLTAVNLRK